MILEARAADCFASTFALKLDGRPIGKFDGRWFSEGVDVALLGRRRLCFRRAGWLSSEFELIEGDEDEILGRCWPAGLFSSAWELELSGGPGRLVRSGWLTSSFDIVRDEAEQGRVDRLGWCERGWEVDAGSALTEDDLLLIGLLYHTLQRRQAQHNQAGGHAAGS